MTYIQAIRESKNAEELLRRRSSAFCLLYLIARRARRTDDTNFNDLEIGEALVGDNKTYGASDQVYRTDKIFLEKFNFITTRSTNRGTVAKLVDKTIFDINAKSTNEQTNTQLTSKQQTANDQLTTNKNVKKDKNDNKENKNDLNSLKEKSFLKDIQGDKYALVKKYHLSDSYLEETVASLVDYCKSHGKVYKDYRATLLNWIRRDIQKNPQNFKIKLLYKHQ